MDKFWRFRRLAVGLTPAWKLVWACPFEYWHLFQFGRVYVLWYRRWETDLEEIDYDDN